MSQTDLEIKSEYHTFFPKLSAEEYNGLKKSVKENGLFFPIIVNEDGVILDGHHRYLACLDMGVQPKVEIKKFNNPLLEKAFVVDSNVNRRHLNDFQKAKMAHMLEKIEGELAKQRYESTLPKKGEKGFQLLSSSNELNTGQTRVIVARKVGLSPTTYRRAKTIIEQGSEEVKRKVETGEWSINRGYNTLKPREEKPRTFKCQACMEQYEEPEKPVNISLCRRCEMEFQTWKAEKELEDLL